MTTALARKFRVDVTSDLTLATGWLQLNGVTDLDPEIAPNLEDASAYDTNGWSSSEITMYDWTLAATVFRRLTGSTYDPGQELARLCQGQFGTAARLGVRWYDKNGGPEAFSGVAVVTWKRSNTGVKNLEQAAITFTGTDVPLNMNITNPGTAAVAPVILAASPSAQSVGKILSITGASFLGTTGITIGGVAVATGAFTVQSDNLITAVMPAGSAGSAPIIVTNAVGASSAFAFTRGA